MQLSLDSGSTLMETVEQLEQHDTDVAAAVVAVAGTSRSRWQRLVGSQQTLAAVAVVVHHFRIVAE